MAGPMHLGDVHFSLAGVDLSDHVLEFSCPDSPTVLEAQTMGDDYKERVGGLKDFSLVINFQMRRDTGEIYDTVAPLVGTVATFEAKADATAPTSVTNEMISGSVLISDFDWIPGKLDQISTFQVTWPGSSTLTRATT